MTKDWKFSRITNSSAFWIIIALTVFTGLQLQLAEYIIDDAYIHLTFAKNIAAGNGFSFNPDEPTYGVSAPIWTFLLALLSFPFSVGPGLAKILSVVLGLAAIPLFRYTAISFGISNRTATLATLVWALNVWLVRWTASGMETSLAVLLLLLAFDSQVKQKKITGFWFGLAILCRPESALLALVMLIDYLVTKGLRSALIAFASIVAVVTPWLVYAWITFGTLLPNPAKVKTDFGLPAWTDFVLGLKRTTIILIGSNGIEIALCIALIVFILVKPLRISKENVRKAVILLSWAIIPAVFCLSRGIFIQSRYLLIGIPPIIIGTFLALERFHYRGLRIGWSYLRFILVLLLICQQLFLTWRITLPHVKAFSESVNALVRMSAILKWETPPEASVAIGDVGIVGYYSERYILDLEGLVSHEVIPHRVGRRLDDVIKQEMYTQVRTPDYIIDKAQMTNRLEALNEKRYQVLAVEPVPGGLVDTADEEWFYTLYRILPDSELDIKERLND